MVVCLVSANWKLLEGFLFAAADLCPDVFQISDGARNGGQHTDARLDMYGLQIADRCDQRFDAIVCVKAGRETQEFNVFQGFTESLA